MTRTELLERLGAADPRLVDSAAWNDAADITRGQYPALQRPTMPAADLTRLARRSARGQYAPRYREQVDAYASASRYARRIKHYASRAAAELVARARDHTAADDAAVQRALAHRVTYPRIVVTSRPNAARPINRSAVFGRIQLLPPRRDDDTTLYDRTAVELESYADYLLARYAGATIHRTDVMDRKTRRVTIAPDRVAFRGVARYTRPVAAVNDARGTTTDTTTGRVLLATRLRGARRVFVGYNSRGETVHTAATDTTRRGWLGHTAYAVAAPVRARGAASTAARAAARPVRADGAAARGRVATAWTLAPRSLPRRWRDATDAQRATAAELVAILTTSADGVPIPIGRGEIVERRDATTVVRANGASFTIIDYARRAALAAVVID